MWVVLVDVAMNFRCCFNQALVFVQPINTDCVQEVLYVSCIRYERIPISLVVVCY